MESYQPGQEARILIYDYIHSLDRGKVICLRITFPGMFEGRFLWIEKWTLLLFPENQAGYVLFLPRKPLDCLNNMFENVDDRGRSCYILRCSKVMYNLTAVAERLFLEQFFV